MKTQLATSSFVFLVSIALLTLLISESTQTESAELQLRTAAPGSYPNHVRATKLSNTLAHIVSDATTVYTETLVPGWETLSFDDSAWLTVIAPSAGLCNPSIARRIPDSTALPVWGRNPQSHQTIYARKTFTIQTPVSATIRVLADDDFDLYVNGVLVRADWDGREDGVHQDNISALVRNGMNVIAIKARDTAGGCQHLAFDVTIQPPTSFLDLPVSYSNFAHAAQGNVGGNGPGRVNSWFDHTSPNYYQDEVITTWFGRYYGLNPSDNCATGLNCYDGHNGIDFQHQWGTNNEPVFAAAPGTVAEVCRNYPCSRGGSYGNYVLINHGNGFATFYAHLKSVNTGVAEGTQITDPRAQPLGVMGGTGGWPVHLHFGVYYDQNGDGQWAENEVVDPYGYQREGSDPWSIPSYYLWKYPVSFQGKIGSPGGNATTPSGSWNVTVPSRAVTSTVTLELWDTPPVAVPSAQLRSTGLSCWLRVPEWLSGGGASRTLVATPLRFAQPITITVTYTDAETLHLDETHLTIHRWDESISVWSPLTTTVDINQSQATAHTTELGYFDLQAPLLCPADTTEPDDNYYAATTIQADGVSVSRLFDIAQDEDWFKFNAMAEKLYELQTANLASGVDTLLEIYDTDGITVLASDDNSGSGTASRLEWQAPQDGTYFIRVYRVASSAYGCDATYQLSVTPVSVVHDFMGRPEQGMAMTTP